MKAGGPGIVQRDLRRLCQCLAPPLQQQIRIGHRLRGGIGIPEIKAGIVPALLIAVAENQKQTAGGIPLQIVHHLLKNRFTVGQLGLSVSEKAVHAHAIGFQIRH